MPMQPRPRAETVSSVPRVRRCMKWCSEGWDVDELGCGGASSALPSARQDFVRAEDASRQTHFEWRSNGGNADFGGSSGNGRIAPWGGEISARQPEKNFGVVDGEERCAGVCGTSREGAPPALLQFRSVEIRVTAASRRAIVYQPSTSNTGASRHAQT